MNVNPVTGIGAAVLAAMTEKIERLQCENDQLRAERHRLTRAELRAMLHPLRLREAVLLYFGKAPLDQWLDELERAFEGVDLSAEKVFDFNNAPIEPEACEAIRAALVNANYGNACWTRTAPSGER